MNEWNSDGYSLVVYAIVFVVCFLLWVAGDSDWLEHDNHVETFHYGSEVKVGCQWDKSNISGQQNVFIGCSQTMNDETGFETINCP